MGSTGEPGTAHPPFNSVVAYAASALRHATVKRLETSEKWAASLSVLVKKAGRYGHCTRVAAEDASLASLWEVPLCLSRVRAKSHSSRTILALSSSRERRSRSSVLPSLSAGTFEGGRPQIVFDLGRCQFVI